MAAAVCKHVGARHVVITDVNDYRLDLAKACGADMALNVTKGDPDLLIESAMGSLGMRDNAFVTIIMFVIVIIVVRVVTCFV
jgi:threonine 3-dehydrogenase